MTALAAWQNFYVIVGSSAGALIGLQFVVLSLIASRPVGGGTADAGHAFATPTIVHFGAVLGLAGILSAPWDKIGTVAVFWGLAGLAGVVYTLIVTGRMRRQGSYKPEFEDWLFHAALPLAAYGMVAGSAWAALFHLREALFCVGSALLMLLFVGIHNTWDGLTYHVFVRSSTGEQPPSRDVEEG